ncbi:MAG: Gfo/Idh/MocA family oxidoreductase [Terriglobales bacterium]|jgi:predicted dehydrogenase
MRDVVADCRRKQPGLGEAVSLVLRFPIQGRNCDNSQFILLSGARLLSSEYPINIAVIGVGAFGRNHARVYQQLQQAGGVRLVGVVDPDTARADMVAREFGCKSFGSVEQMLTTHSEVQAASVAVPTVLHRKVASMLMEAGVDVLIEKPLAATLAEADELLRLAAAHKRVAQVGHLERFNPAVRATLPLLNRPMFFEVHRLSVFSPRALDVDVVLDLMIHDLDVVLTFVKSRVQEIRAVGLPILSGKVDIANVRIEFESGCVANFTASRVSTERVRKLRFFQAGQYVSIDYGRQDVLVFSVAGGAEIAHALAQNADDSRTRPSLNPQIAMAKPPITAEEPLLAEIKAFLQSVRERSRPVVSLEDGRQALELGLAILAEIARHAGRIGVGNIKQS